MSTGTYQELVRSILTTLFPTTVMSILFACVVNFTLSENPDAALLFIGYLGIAISMLRVGVLIWFQRTLNRSDEDPAGIRKFEVVYAFIYVSFAICLGLFGMRVAIVGTPDLQLITGLLVLGYGAGVAAGVSLRPKIAIPSLVIAVAPFVVLTSIFGDSVHRLVGFLITAFAIGGIGSIVRRYRSEF